MTDEETLDLAQEIAKHRAMGLPTENALARNEELTKFFLAYDLYVQRQPLVLAGKIVAIWPSGLHLPVAFPEQPSRIFLAVLEGEREGIARMLAMKDYFDDGALFAQFR
jgi:hypothetical protein